jgi:hypothetical protein
VEGCASHHSSVLLSTAKCFAQSRSNLLRQRGFHNGGGFWFCIMGLISGAHNVMIAMRSFPHPRTYRCNTRAATNLISVFEGFGYTKEKNVENLCNLSSPLRFLFQLQKTIEFGPFLALPLL